MVASHTIGVRLDPSLLARLDAVAERAAATSAVPVPLDRATVLRGIVLRFLPQVETELGIGTSGATAPVPARLAPAQPARASDAAEGASPKVATPKTPDPDAVRAALEAAIERGEGQGQLADRLGIHRTNMSNFRRGKRPLSAAHLAALAKELGV